MKRYPLPRNIAATLTGLYIVLGGYWIIFSDYLLKAFVTDPERIQQFQTFKGWAYIILTGGALYLLISHYLRRLHRREEMLREVAEAVGGRKGDDYLRTLVEHLARVLQVDIAFIGEQASAVGGRIRTLAVFAGGQLGENFEFDLAGTPWGGALGKEPIELPARAAVLFPADPLLQRRRIGSYFAFPLVGSSDQLLGVLTVMNRRPCRDHHTVNSLLRFFAVRTATELQRLREEESLRAQFDQISAIFDSLSAMVHVVDMERHQLLYMNGVAEDFFGGGWQGKPCFEALRDGHNRCEFCTNEQLKRGGPALPPLIWEYRNDGNNRWYQCINKAIRWPDGRLVRLEIALDITERKEIDRLKDEILSAVSHEMRTPLTAVLGYAEFLLETEVSETERQSCLRVLAEQADRLNELISDFLQLQRLQARRSSFRFQAVPVQPILEEAAKSFRTERLKIDVPAKVSPVLAEEKGLVEILERVISNALKYSPLGEIIMTAREDSGKIVMSVRDNGIGIPPDELERIFDPLYRIDNSDRRQSGGAGLGLALVREVVREHGGQVWAESHLGEGTTFFIALPAATDQ